ncbi:MAG TPA: ACP S-malonyltransferase [Tepidisphaeraceae bacterium]|jgi:[acyl-carrier-protein] S-malonyltransferase|nr:ACP S-malonyltransferase [Tepidisphaeraceae bacterium]
MPSNTFILCPGQGAQTIAMGKDLCGAARAAAEVFALADRILGHSLSSICFDGPEERLNQTDISQPALYTAGVASFRAAEHAGVLDPSVVTAYAGLSLGEYTALHLAGVFSFEDGLKLVAARGRYMQEAAVGTPGGMVAILGADENAIDALCAAAADGEVLVPANLNAPGQIVVSGSKGACDRVLKAAETAGFKAMALKVAGAFHSPLMQSAADRMGDELAAVTFSAPNVTVFSNVTALPHGDVASIKQRLVEQIVSPVQWERTMKGLIAIDEQARFVELCPGRTLAGLAKRISRRLPIESVATAEALVVKNANPA